MKKFTLINLLLLVAMILASCAPAATVAPTAVPTTVPPTAVPTAVPPTKAPVATVAPTVAATTAATAAATAVPAAKTPTIVITLKKGLKWTDGSAFSTKDLIGTYDILWAQGNVTWTYINAIVAKDDLVIEFQLNDKASIRAIMNILRSNIVRPYTQYAKWMDQAAQYRKDKVDVKGDVIKAFLTDLYAFKPAEAVSIGPYKIDPKSVTEAQLILVKNPTGYNADVVKFDKLIDYYGETNATVPLILSGDVDYATHAFPPANMAVFKTLPNYKILGGTTATGPGLWFNQTVYPLGKVEVRQAFAYIIDRKENATVAFGDAGKAIQYMAGFTDAMVPTWLPKDVVAKLNPYTKDLKKAEELLTKIGFKKGTDGQWVDDKGKKFEVEISVPSSFIDWFATAENAAQQLTKFGIKATVRGYQDSERANVQTEGKYQILVDLTTYTSPPHPQTAFNYYLNTPRNTPNTEGKPAGMNWSWTQKGPDGKDVNILTTLDGAVAGFDLAKQQPYLSLLAQIVNEQLPIIQMWERIATDPINVANVEGWKPLDDKIYKNNQGSDNYTAIQLLDGTLSPSKTNTTKKFGTAYPYVQPPKGHYNLFATDSLPVSLGTVYYPIVYPPLFWYMWADNVYTPVLAEKYEIK